MFDNCFILHILIVQVGEVSPSGGRWLRRLRRLQDFRRLRNSPSAGSKFPHDCPSNQGSVLLGMIVNLKLAGEVEACVTVELDISLHLQKTDAHFLGLF